MGHRKSHLIFSFFIIKVLILTSTSKSHASLVCHVVWVIAFVAGSELIEFRGVGPILVTHTVLRDRDIKNNETDKRILLFFSRSCTQRHVLKWGP